MLHPPPPWSSAQIAAYPPAHGAGGLRVALGGQPAFTGERDLLDEVDELAEVFVRLTPGRQRSYLIHLTSSQMSESRVARIIKLRGHILAGKGAQER